MGRERKKAEIDRWMDDEGSSNRAERAKARKGKKGAGEKEALSQSEGNATIAEVFRNQARVVTDDGKHPLCAYRRKQVWAQANSRNDQKERSPVAVGDRVKASLFSDRDGVIEGVCERRNQLARPAPDREEDFIHVLVANLDRLVIVASARSPHFSYGIVDRFLVAAHQQSIPVSIVVTKIDLLSANDEREWTKYSSLGFDLHEVSVKKEGSEELQGLQALIDGKHVAFCGHSGVGKTSLLSKLVGQDIGAVGEVNDFTGKGKHTTTSARVVKAEGSTFWIDTPGVKEFGLIDIDENNLKEAFPELNQAGCENSDCSHTPEEKGCRASESPRHPSYLRILKSLTEDQD